MRCGRMDVSSILTIQPICSHSSAEEQLTFNQWAEGSIPSGNTINHLNGLQFGTSCQVHVQGLGEYCRFEFDSQKVTNNKAFLICRQVRLTAEIIRRNVEICRNNSIVNHSGVWLNLANNYVTRGFESLIKA